MVSLGGCRRNKRGIAAVAADVSAAACRTGLLVAFCCVPYAATAITANVAGDLFRTVILP